MKIETVEKLAFVGIVITTVLEVLGTIALAILGVVIAHHFIVKFW